MRKISGIRKFLSIAIPGLFFLIHPSRAHAWFEHPYHHHDWDHFHSYPHYYHHNYSHQTIFRALKCFVL